MAPRRRTAPQEPATVLVEWTRTTTDAGSEHGCHIGPRHYQGRAGQRVQMRGGDAQILAAGGFVVPATHQTAARTT